MVGLRISGVPQNTAESVGKVGLNESENQLNSDEMIWEKIIEQRDSQVVEMRENVRSEDKNDIDGTLSLYVTLGS